MSLFSLEFVVIIHEFFRVCLSSDCVHIFHIHDKTDHKKALARVCAISTCQDWAWHHLLSRPLPPHAHWINGWVNIREAGDLRRHRVHYDVIVMIMGMINMSIKSRRGRHGKWKKGSTHVDRKSKHTTRASILCIKCYQYARIELWRYNDHKNLYIESAAGISVGCSNSCMP